VEELIVEALVPVDAPAYRDWADQESLFAMVIPFASAQDKPFAFAQDNPFACAQDTPFAPGRSQFFLSHHRWRNTWELPSGKVESGESPVQAAERELLEEMGAQVDQLRPLGILLTRLAQAPGQGHLYWGNVIQQSDLPQGSEMDAVRAFSLDVLPAPEQMAPVTAWVVRWMAGRLIANDE